MKSWVLAAGLLAAAMSGQAMAADLDDGGPGPDRYGSAIGHALLLRLRRPAGRLSCAVFGGAAVHPIHAAYSPRWRFAARRRKRSTRPPVSTSFCLPV